MVHHSLIKKRILYILSVNLNIFFNNIYGIYNVNRAVDFFPGVNIRAKGVLFEMYRELKHTLAHNSKLATYNITKTKLSILDRSILNPKFIKNVTI